MKLSRSTWFAIIFLVIWLLLSWKLGVWIGMKPPKLYYLRGGLCLLGIIGFAGYLLFRPKTKKDVAEGWAAAAISEVEFNFAEATKRVQAGGVKTLNQLPAVFLVGDAASAKTSVIAKSGLEPELLAGHAYQDYVVAPTRVLNLWFARRILFIDPAGAVIADAGVRKRLFKKFAPVKLTSVLGGKQPPPRSVVFTVDCDTFLQHGGADALAQKAREFQTILTELSQELGSNFPVYVLFTKTDKLSYFRDYVETFTETEATEVFGVTLPMQTAQARGVYAEQETKRLTDAFQDLYLSLCERRPTYLAREHDQAKLPNIYEFPREFAKLRSLLVQFLVDLCRPSQLGTTPFLRGFYFTGVRPVTVEDLAPAASFTPVVEDAGFDAGATRIFNPGSGGRPGLMQAEVRESGARRVPQWVFLSHLISELILVDQPALVATQGSVKLNFWRRTLLAAAAAVALFMAVWWIVSYRNNHELVTDAVEAAKAVPSAGLAAGQLASLDSLQRLERVRGTLDRLRGYEQDGVPFSLSGFLYAGDAIREPLRKTYYSLFRKILLLPTQQTLIALCNRPEAYQAQGYRFIYNSLRAYLITTNHHEKSTMDFLPPVLLSKWQKDQQVDPERNNLANKNFEFYAQDLPDENPFPHYANPDTNAVETARAYLKQFAQVEQIYETMLLEAGKGLHAIVFNNDFKESRGLIINTYRVEPAFTKKGYEAFMKQLQDPEKYFNGEEWVLGAPLFVGTDKQEKVQQIRQMYQANFVKTWRSYLHATSFAGYTDPPDVVNKLGRLTSNQSPILEVLCVASENTSVETKDVADIFQPIQFVTPPGCLKKLSSAPNQPYIAGLIQLQGAVQQVTQATPATAESINSANNVETQVEGITKGIGSGFNSDRDEPRIDSKTLSILLDPLVRVPPALGNIGKAQINAAAKGACLQIQGMLNKYPFNRASAKDATLDETNLFLKPKDGVLWKLYEEQLKKLIEQSSPGSDFTPKADAPLKVSGPFLRYFNRAVHMSEAFYKNGAGAPNFTFSMQAVPVPDVYQVTLSLHGATLTQNLREAPHGQVFTWPGSTQTANLKAKLSPDAPEQDKQTANGLWAVWRLLDTAEPWQTTGAQYQIQWVAKVNGVPTMIGGHPEAVKFLLDPQGSQVFKPGFFNGMGCVATAVQ